MEFDYIFEQHRKNADNALYLFIFTIMTMIVLPMLVLSLKVETIDIDFQKSENMVIIDQNNGVAATGGSTVTVKPVSNHVEDNREFLDIVRDDPDFKIFFDK